jgi:hypothetical protein
VVALSEPTIRRTAVQQPGELLSPARRPAVRSPGTPKLPMTVDIG